jgi:hypothetical protein
MGDQRIPGWGSREEFGCLSSCRHEIFQAHATAAVVACDCRIIRIHGGGCKGFEVDEYFLINLLDGWMDIIGTCSSE